MTDIDELLRADAARWQAEVNRPRAVRSRPGHRRPWVPALAAAAAVVVVAGVATALVHGRGDHHALASASTASRPAPSTIAALDGVTWTDRASGSTAAFTATAVRLDDGCDASSHALSVDARTLAVGRAVGVQSVCGGLPAPPSGPARAAYDLHNAMVATFYRVLTGQVDWSVTGGVLRIVKPGVGSLTFDAKGHAYPLTGTTWQLNRVANGRNGELPGRYSAALVIRAGGSASVSDGCNTYTGTVAVTDTTIDFGRLRVVRPLPCPYSPAHGAIDTVLAGTADYSLYRNELVIADSHGAVLVYLPAR